MITISGLQTGLKSFHAQAKHASSIHELQDAWKRIFHTSLSNSSAKSFLKYYREMTRKTKSIRMRGGSSSMITPAPLQYTMVPGVLQQFPVPMHTSVGGYGADTSMDPKYIQDLDVYFANSLTKGCGVENAGLTVPADMGSNRVTGGGRSRRHGRRRAAKTYKRRAVVNRRGRRTWKHRGGNLMESLGSRMVLSTAPPNYAQSMYASVTGSTQPVPFPGNPTIAEYSQYSNGASGLINPGLVTGIRSDMTTMARPAVWQTAN